jgi:hypothetical protein
VGLERQVARAADSIDIAAVLERLKARNFPSSVMMIDGQLVMPAAALPPGWRDLRLRTPGGTVTVARRPAGVAVLVFGNADASLQEAQRVVAEAIEAGA